MEIATGIRRRHFLAGGLGAAAAMFSPAWLRAALAAPASPGPSPYGELLPPDALGLMLPPGFSARRISRGGEPVGPGAYVWHFAPDGQASFRTSDGGHVLVQNSEAPGALGGGSSAMRFGPDGSLQDAYRILAGSNLNCAGGPTPWGTWLSGEEHEGGMIWESDPAGRLPAVPRPALGNFSHEAAAVDLVTGHVYLSEDQGDGLFYRFTPDRQGDLSAGLLEAAALAPDGSVTWHPVPDPNIVRGGRQPRYQVPQATRFNGGEGLWYFRDVVYYTTKGDRRVWAYDCRAQTMEVIYDYAVTPNAALNAVDNVTVSPSGDVYVCEDGGNMEICLITPGPDRTVSPFLRLVGDDHRNSEMTGVVFDPSGTRMYFSSQRSYAFVPPGAPRDSHAASRGATYEVTGPFRLPAGGVPEDWVYGPPIGERAGASLPAPPGLDARVVGAGLDGVRIKLALERAARVHVSVRSFDLEKESRGDGTHDRPLPVTLGSSSADAAAGSSELSIRLRGRAPSAVVTVVAERADGTRRVAAERVKLL